jgi:hypothetical protein
MCLDVQRRWWGCCDTEGPAIKLMTLTPSDYSHAEGDKEAGDPSKHTPGPREGENSQANILGKEQHGCLLPAQSSEFDLGVSPLLEVALKGLLTSWSCSCNLRASNGSTSTPLAISTSLSEPTLLVILARTCNDQRYASLDERLGPTMAMELLLFPVVCFRYLKKRDTRSKTGRLSRITSSTVLGLQKRRGTRFHMQITPCHDSPLSAPSSSLTNFVPNSASGRGVLCSITRSFDVDSS